MKAHLYGRDLNLARRSFLEELCDRSSKTLLMQNSTNDCVHEHGRAGEVFYPPRETRV